MTPDFISRIVTQENAISKDYDWGTFITYFNESTISLKDALMGVALIKPGEEIHPPHQHEDEEYLMVSEGTGEWIVNGERSPAKPGDVLYTHPWEWHGIVNTGDTTMTFVIMKWVSKGVEYPDNAFGDLGG